MNAFSMPVQLDQIFAQDYIAARERFRKAAVAADAKLYTLPIDARGPNGEELSIDIARIGKKRAKRVLLHSSGIHGVEGFAGSAVQVALLKDLPWTRKNTSLVLVHCLNPYGMAWLRRANENNVDLNRNFIHETDQRNGAHAVYHRMHDFLNPFGRSKRYSFFVLRLIIKILIHGFQNLKQAGGQGQFAYPHGLFFGGFEMEQGPRLYLKWLQKNLRWARRICVVDVHTGVGEYGEDWLILERNFGGPLHQTLEREYAGRLDVPGQKGALIYDMLGGMETAFPHLFPRKEIDYITQEFGTVSGTRLLKALRDENREHHHQEAAPDLGHWTKKQIRDAFNPDTSEWRKKVLRGGRQAFDLALKHLCR
ncbi:MAG: DUF2817 domain-containing protein [Leptospiraceae bacterium]|nr:DUF2817 domain-containing protein [Leptospiraceae bacterium]